MTDPTLSERLTKRKGHGADRDGEPQPQDQPPVQPDAPGTAEGKRIRGRGEKYYSILGTDEERERKKLRSERVFAARSVGAAGTRPLASQRAAATSHATTELSPAQREAQREQEREEKERGKEEEEAEDEDISLLEGAEVLPTGEEEAERELSALES